MNFDDHAVGTHSDGGFRQCRNQAAFPGSVAGVQNYGQVSEFVEYRNGGNIASVAGGGFKRADAALTQHHLRIAMRHNVLRGHQQFLNGGTEAAFQKYGTAAFAQHFQQREVLHVARADLQNVRIPGDKIHIPVAHYFSDDGESGGFAGLGEQL